MESTGGVPAGAEKWHPHKTEAGIETEAESAPVSLINARLEKYLTELGSDEGDFNIDAATELVAVLVHDMKDCTTGACNEARPLMVRQGVMSYKGGKFEVVKDSEGIKYAAEKLAADLLSEAYIYVSKSSSKGLRGDKEKDAGLGRYREEMQQKLTQFFSHEYVPTRDAVEFLNYSDKKDVASRRRGYVETVLTKSARDPDWAADMEILRSVGAVNESGVFVLENKHLGNMVKAIVSDVVEKFRGNNSGVLFLLVQEKLREKIKDLSGVGGESSVDKKAAVSR